MEPTVSFRDFEERDTDFIYRCKNDEKLNSMIVGDWHPFTYEEAVKWVHGCMGEHDTFKFWAVCTNDEEKRIVGWVSLSQINILEKSAIFHGIVIGDPHYRDAMAWIESYLFIYDYAFRQLKMENVYGEALTEHILSQSIRKAMYAKTIEVKENAIFRDGKYHDVSRGLLTRQCYYEHLNNGDYLFTNICLRISKYIKQMKS
jgi:RimJ/RimL family protein N-acetyltransferase